MASAAVLASPIRTAACERIASALEQRPFEMARIYPALGVATLEKLKAEVRYDFAATKLGGTVQIRTTNKEALKAVHEFLRFQISDHKTGDTLTVAQ